MPNVPIIRAASQKELHRQVLLSSLRVTGVRLGAQHGQKITSPSLDCFPVQALPVPLRCQVFIRTGEFEHEFGTLVADNGQLTKTSLRQPVLGFPEDATTADVILRRIGTTSTRKRGSVMDIGTRRLSSETYR